MLPGDQGALKSIIYRNAKDWEQSFVLQYNGLQRWLIEIRDALTSSEDFHTVSCEDLEEQIRYILFLLGQYASPESSFLQACFEAPFPPCRPFGVGASVALICHAFMSIGANNIRGYKIKNLWVRDESFFSYMLAELRNSPIFSAELSMESLQVIIGNLQRAFQSEEVRVASMKPRKIDISKRAELIQYYTGAFLSLDPTLLPKISHVALGIKLPENCTHLHLATHSANLFYDGRHIQSLEQNFKKVSDIIRSKPDRVVVTEMFHVKAWQGARRGDNSDENWISVLHVDPRPGTRSEVRENGPCLLTGDQHLMVGDTSD